MELTLLQAADAATLLAFETQHRDAFERWMDPRPESFYTPEVFAQTLQAALQQQAAGLAWHYLIWCDGVLAGRISLTHVQRTPAVQATLSYRIAPGYDGHGLATEAVAMVMQKAFHVHHLQRLTAPVRPQNKAAVQVLLKNGFHPHGHATTQPQLHRQWLDVLHYEATLPVQRAVQQAHA